MSITSEPRNNLDFIASHAKKEKNILDKYQKNIYDADKENVELQGRIKFFKLRTKWSWAIIVWITAILTFTTLLTIKIGLGILNFERYPLLIHEIFAGIFFQVFGMGYIIVKCLFPNNMNNLANFEPAEEN